MLGSKLASTWWQCNPESYALFVGGKNWKKRWQAVEVKGKGDYYCSVFGCSEKGDYVHGYVWKVSSIQLDLVGLRDS